MKKNAKNMGHSGTSRRDHLKKTKKDARFRKGKRGLDADGHSEKKSKDGTTTKQHSTPMKHPSVLRKKVDPGTAKYFSEIVNLFDGNGVDLEERPIICANALDETIGKELELATDMIISRIIQTLIEGCDLDRLCSFLQRCTDDFLFIAMDKCGSHVVETALKSLTAHLQDQDTHEIIEETLAKICQVVVADPVNMMCSCYGSHVLRSLLCLCKGMPLDSLEEFHIKKSSGVLAARLNIKSTHSHEYLSGLQQGFPELLKFLVTEMLMNAGNEIKTLRVNKYSSFVLQVAMKLLVGDDQELRKVIFMLLCCSEENTSEGLLESDIQEIMDLVKDSAASHLLEVILEVAPDNVYEEILQKVFQGSLLEMSSHHCGNFAVQALVSSARCKSQVDLIWEELGTKMKELLEIGKSGVVASLLASCQRLETHGQECCKVLADAVCSETESPSFIVPKLLFLNNYLCCKEKSSWQWPSGDRMHVLGCLMLQTIFGFPNHCFSQYANSLLSIETEQVLEMVKDAAGSHVVESFLCSDASAKVKHKVISKLKDHFGELSLHPFGSFTVEKCFAVGKLSLKESIMLELSTVKDELSKTKHGVHILKKLDVDRFVKRPEQWKSSQFSKENVYKEYQTAFGTDTKTRGETFVSQSSHASQKKRVKGHKQQTPQTGNFTSDPHCSPFLEPKIPGFELSMAKLGFPSFKNGKKRSGDADVGKTTASNTSKKFVRNSVENCFVRQGGNRKSSSSELADLAGKKALSQGDVRKLFQASTESQKKVRN